MTIAASHLNINNNETDSVSNPSTDCNTHEEPSIMNTTYIQKSLTNISIPSITKHDKENKQEQPVFSHGRKNTQPKGRKSISTPHAFILN